MRAESGAPLAAALAVFVVTGPCAAAPLEAYGRLPSIENVAISPDGQLLAVAITNGERRKIVVRKTADSKTLIILNGGNQKLRGMTFAGSSHLIVTGSVTGYINDVMSARLESMVGVSIDLASGKQHGLLAGLESDSGDNLTSIEGPPVVREIKGKPVVFVMGVHFIDGRGQAALFRVNLVTHSATLADPGGANVSDYAVGEQGPVAESEYDGAKGEWLLRGRRGDGWQKLRSATAANDPPDLLGTGRDGVSALISFTENNIGVTREISPSGAAGEAMPLAAPEALYWDVEGPKLIGEAALEGDDERVVFFAPRDQTVWNAIAAAYPGQRVSLVDYSAARDRFVVLVDSPTEGLAYALVDLTSGKADWIGNVYDGLKSADIAPVRPVAFKAKDGLDLSGYLTLPRGKAETGLPLVLLVHGGPAARDRPGFDWWAQALASRGYAVLQVNYRGSAGLGWNLQSAGFGQWGRRMQTDLSDGVRYLVGEGLVDPSRVCIVGASYGGYAALAGATLDTGIYRCAASIGGVADPEKMIRWDLAREDDAAGAATQRYWIRYMGPAGALDQISPLRHVDKAAIPILLVHGKDDTVVSYAQSQMMADALRKAGKPVEFVTLPGEDHWLSRGATRLEMLEAVTIFLEKNNPPG
jgi:dipeptidyl aminopeptidase/acylaminoacyl peptidase